MTDEINEIKDDAVIAAVIYTDGGARTNPGCIGFGAHGYIHEVTESKPNKADNWYITDDGYKKVIKDSNHTSVTPIKYIDMVGSSTAIETNNRAEIKAVIAILEQLKGFNLSKLLIHTDSDYVNRGVNEWLPGWSSRDFIKSDGKPVINDDLWKQLDSMLSTYNDVELTLRWIKAHNGDLGNEEADSLATMGNNISLNGRDVLELEVTDPKGYWKPLSVKCPLLNHKRVYFNSLPEYNKPGQYYQADPGVKDLLVGKRVPEASYSVVKLKEPDALLEQTIKRQYDAVKLPNEDGYYNGIFLIKVDIIYNKKVLKNLIKHKAAAMSVVNKSYNLNAPNNENLTVELNPTGLCMRAINNFNLLEELLDKYIEDTSGGSDSQVLNAELINVTDTFFEVKAKKDKLITQLHKDITNTNRNFSLSLIAHGKDISFPISLGNDLPDRNSLKKLESYQPKIQIITWLTAEAVVKYGFIIDCDLGVGIWSNYFSDTIYL